jgi:hypothetical protein
MGVATGDVDQDGKADLVVTNLSNEGYTLYRNEGRLFFTDISFPSGAARASLLLTGWGVGFLDYDNDGDADMFGVNGHVMDNIEILNPSLRYLQPALLLENEQGRYTDVTSLRGDSLAVPRPARGAAFGDFDNDGDVDVLVANCNEAPVLLRNDGGNQQHWLTVRCVGRRSNRDSIGARVKLTAGGKTQIQGVAGGGSYLSSSDRRLHFGLGSSTVVDQIEIQWPSGKSQVLRGIAADQFLRVEENK